MAAEFFTKVQVKNEEQNIRKLMTGRIDMFLASKSVALFRAKNMGVLDKIDFIPKAIITGYNYVAFSKKTGHDTLAAEFSESLKKFKTTSEYKTIRQKYGHR
jgi:polar amino acid transport system substrate-binding protein